jgi:hypothetical protein
LDTRIRQGDSHRDDRKVDHDYRGVGDSGNIHGIKLALVSGLDGIDPSDVYGIGDNLIDGFDESV